ncbi:hypothetical protein VFPPC_18433 [Pochonia chlamydosporia 170]|uniref:Uncharacterized protein n=1 Tax=Pochonia chlamydosporia 170 TaxID=1380566 RepID=A0A219ANX1_METCM|nr:hypothetical protein VFPPC_18433 [Pochonia chlamydosporia 170]OWT42279.1 hypothetical protein VFPPC_18433 [Pochonia chlamydosporia 170]
MYAYTYHPEPTIFGDESIIVFCRGKLQSWATMYAQRERVGNYHNAGALTPGVYTLDHLWEYLPATLIHELTHARVVVQQNVLGMTLLSCIRQLAIENPTFAATNAGMVLVPFTISQGLLSLSSILDSFSLFVTGTSEAFRVTS